MTARSNSGRFLSQIDGRVHAVDVPLVQLPAQQVHGFSESLKMDHLPLPEELDDVVDVRIVRKPEDVVIGDPCLLLRGQILGQICEGVALDGHGGRGPGEAGGGSGVDPGGVVDEVGGEGGVLDLGIGHLAGELMDDGADHLQVAQFLCTCIGVKMTPRGSNLG